MMKMKNEIKQATFYMNPNGALQEDGFNGLF